MDVFSILSRGASLKRSKDKQFKPHVDAKGEASSQARKQDQFNRQIERETDFFRTKRHAPEEKIEEVKEEGIYEEPPLKINSEEDAAVLRKANRVNVTGSDIPLSIGSFEDLIRRFNLNKKVLSNVIDAEFTEPTAIQCETIPFAMNDRDVIACAPTGSGKTLAYLIPLIQKLVNNFKDKKGIRSIIIAPTNELASQIFQVVETLTRGTGAVVGLLTKQLAAKFTNKAVISSKYQLLVSTPLRLIDVVNNESVDLSSVSDLVIDEADKLFDKGFVKQTDEILATCTHPKLRKSIFSATIPSGVEDMAQSIMKDPIRVIVGHKEAASSNIEQSLVFTGNEVGKLLAIRQMIQNSEFHPPVIIFLQSIIRAKALFHELIYDKLNVDVIHAERTPKQRDEVIKRFKNGDIWVLITTDVLSRGVDFKGVNLVINYDVPQTAQAYVHRIGRTGRGTKKGRAVTFFTKEDSLAVKPVINVMKASGCTDGFSGWMEDMGKLSKREKETIKRKQIERKQISTVPKVMKQKRKRKQEMISASKKRDSGDK